MAQQFRVPVFQPYVGKEEADAVYAAVRRKDISGTCDEVIEFEDEFAKFIGVPYAIATSSGTTALHLAVSVLDLAKNSSLIVSDCTNIATALAAYHNGYNPVGCDTDISTWNLNPIQLAALDKFPFSSEVIIPVHAFGNPVDMDLLPKNKIVIEDCAQAIGATYKGRRVGSIGTMGCFSFYANKIITTGEGGMVVTKSSELAEKLRAKRNLCYGSGDNRFIHSEAGYNFRMTGIQAAMGLAQLKRFEWINSERRYVGTLYRERLLQVPQVALQRCELYHGTSAVDWTMPIVIKGTEPCTARNVAMKLEGYGIETRPFFYPINKQPCFRHVNRFVPPSTNTMSLYERGLLLPMGPHVTESIVDEICSIIRRELVR